MGHLRSRNIQILSNKFLPQQFLSHNSLRYQRVSKFNNINLIHSEKSFNSVDLWLKDLKANSSPDIKIFLIGNKTDLEEHRVIKTEQAKRFSEQYELDYFMESSAKSGMNVQEIFIHAAKILYKDFLEYNLNKKKSKEKEKEKSKKLEEKNSSKKKGCC